MDSRDGKQGRRSTQVFWGMLGECTRARVATVPKSRLHSPNRLKAVCCSVSLFLVMAAAAAAFAAAAVYCARNQVGSSRVPMDQRDAMGSSRVPMDQRDANHYACYCVCLTYIYTHICVHVHIYIYIQHYHNLISWDIYI